MKNPNMLGEIPIIYSDHVPAGTMILVPRVEIVNYFNLLTRQRTETWEWNPRESAAIINIKDRT